MVSVYVIIFELQPVFLKESESLGLDLRVWKRGAGRWGRDPAFPLLFHVNLVSPTCSSLLSRIPFFVSKNKLKKTNLATKANKFKS